MRHLLIGTKLFLGLAFFTSSVAMASENFFHTGANDPQSIAKRQKLEKALAEKKAALQKLLELIKKHRKPASDSAVSDGTYGGLFQSLDKILSKKKKASSAQLVCPAIARVCNDGSTAKAKADGSCGAVCSEDTVAASPAAAEVAKPVAQCPAVMRVCQDGSTAVPGLNNECGGVCREDDARVPAAVISSGQQ